MKNKKFLKGGVILVAIIILYEILALLSMRILGIASIVLIWLPFLPTRYIFENLALNIISTFILIFIIGGTIYSIIKKD